MKPTQHVRALIVLVLITLNLAFWCVPLIAMAVLRFMLHNATPALDRVAAHWYRLAVAFDDWCFANISKSKWQCNGVKLDKEQTCIVIANHVSWTDIFLLQSAIAKDGPIIKFVMKKQLLYVPIFAMIAYAFKFPFVKRRSAGETDAATRRAQDLARVREACQVLHSSPAAMMVFAEGTRFTLAKKAANGADYQHLLKPRTGGFSVLVDSLVEFEPPVLDCTLFYPDGFTFWRFLGGAGGDVRLSVGHVIDDDRIALFADPSSWLTKTWKEKDLKIGEDRGPHSV